MDLTSAAPSVVIADDHQPTRSLVRSALGAGGFDVVGEASDAGGAIQMVRALNPSVALLDISMPGSGIDAARTISGACPSTAVVMLTVSDDDSNLLDALMAGASGYVLKGTNVALLPMTLHAVLAGEAAIPGTLARRLVGELSARRRRSSIERHGSRLSEREWEVLQLLCEDLSTAEIASRLYVAPVTVRTHVASIIRKLQVTDRDEAVRLVRDHAGPPPA